MLDKMAVRKKLLEQLLAHMDDSQGKDMHELLLSKKKPAVAVEIDMEKKLSPDDLKKHESMESPLHEAKEKAMGDEDDMKEDELEELLKSHGLK